MLGPTFPNREYMHAAQSYGKKDNSLPVDERGFPDSTIFATLTARGSAVRSNEGLLDQVARETGGRILDEGSWATATSATTSPPS